MNKLLDWVATVIAFVCLVVFVIFMAMAPTLMLIVSFSAIAAWAIVRVLARYL